MLGGLFFSLGQRPLLRSHDILACGTTSLFWERLGRRPLLRSLDTVQIVDNKPLNTKHNHILDILYTFSEQFKYLNCTSWNNHDEQQKKLLYNMFNMNLVPKNVFFFKWYFTSYFPSFQIVEVSMIKETSTQTVGHTYGKMPRQIEYIFRTFL